MKKVFRIFEVKDGNIKSLFHGTDGSRTLPLDTWIQANIKEVRDGRGNFTYQSGFHVLLSEEEAINFFEKMFRIKENRQVLPCYIRGELRPKHKNPRKCVKQSWLADEILIKSEEVFNEN